MGGLTDGQCCAGFRILLLALFATFGACSGEIDAGGAGGGVDGCLELILAFASDEIDGVEGYFLVHRVRVTDPECKKMSKVVTTMYDDKNGNGERDEDEPRIASSSTTWPDGGGESDYANLGFVSNQDVRDRNLRVDVVVTLEDGTQRVGSYEAD